jgi:hypothetical protein
MVFSFCFMGKAKGWFIKIYVLADPNHSGPGTGKTLTAERYCSLNVSCFLS